RIHCCSLTAASNPFRLTANELSKPYGPALNWWPDAQRHQSSDLPVPAMRLRCKNLDALLRFYRRTGGILRRRFLYINQTLSDQICRELVASSTDSRALFDLIDLTASRFQPLFRAIATIRRRSFRTKTDACWTGRHAATLWLMTDYRWCSMRAPKSIVEIELNRCCSCIGDGVAGLLAILVLARFIPCEQVCLPVMHGMKHRYRHLYSTGVATGMSHRCATGMSTRFGTGMSTGVATVWHSVARMSTGVGTCVWYRCRHWLPCVIIKAVMRFPQYRLNINDGVCNPLVSHRLRYLMSRGQYPGEVWYYAYFPSAKEHNHVMLASAPGVHLPQAMSDLSTIPVSSLLICPVLPVAKQPADASLRSKIPLLALVVAFNTFRAHNHQSSLRLLRQLNMTDCVVRSETSFLALLRRLQQYLTQQRHNPPSHGSRPTFGPVSVSRGRPLKDPLLPRPARLTAFRSSPFHCVNAREGDCDFVYAEAPRAANQDDRLTGSQRMGTSCAKRRNVREPGVRPPTRQPTCRNRGQDDIDLLISFHRGASSGCREKSCQEKHCWSNADWCNSNDEASGAIGCVAGRLLRRSRSDSVSTPSEGSDSEIRKMTMRTATPAGLLLGDAAGAAAAASAAQSSRRFYSGDPQMSTKLQSNLRDLIDGGGMATAADFDPQMSRNFSATSSTTRSDSKGVATSSRKCRKRATSGEPGVRATYQAADVAGNRGQDDIDSLISFIEGPPQAAGEESCKEKVEEWKRATYKTASEPSVASVTTATTLLAPTRVHTVRKAADHEVSEDDNALKGYSVGGRGHTDYYSDFYRQPRLLLVVRAGNRLPPEPTPEPTTITDDWPRWQQTTTMTMGRTAHLAGLLLGDADARSCVCCAIKPPFGYSAIADVANFSAQSSRPSSTRGGDGNGGQLLGSARCARSQGGRERSGHANHTMDPLLMQQLLQKQHEKQHRGGPEQQSSQQLKQAKQKPLQKVALLSAGSKRPRCSRRDLWEPRRTGRTAGLKLTSSSAREHGAKTQPQPAKKKSSSSAKDRSASSKTNSAASVRSLLLKPRRRRRTTSTTSAATTTTKTTTSTTNREYKDDEAPQLQFEPKPGAIFTDFDSLSSCDREILANGMLIQQARLSQTFEVVLSKKDRRQMRMKPSSSSSTSRDRLEAPMHPNRNPIPTLASPVARCQWQRSAYPIFYPSFTPLC
uniref:Reverse transcriptase domain-containing protein n=1 Tax=Macrostomum lignano TaxID=282301 RepID=A0A1I8JNT5_9PLAT